MMTEPQLWEALDGLLAARAAEAPRLNEIYRYLRNEGTGDIYLPDEATDEYRMLVDQARFNLLPTLVRAVAQNLMVVGYRPTSASGLIVDDNAPVWDRVWQPNRLDARQGAVHRAALKYGVGYTTVLPGLAGGQSAPIVRTYSPRRLTALYEDDQDEWPILALTVSRPEDLSPPQVRQSAASPLPLTVARPATSSLRPTVVKVYDAEAVYTIKLDNAGRRLLSVAEHGLGVCPVVRFLDEVDDDGLSLGKIEPQLPVQRQVNQTTFGLLITQQFQAFRQRWVTGMAMEYNPDGSVKAPWNASVNAVWQNESVDGRFGDFAETSLDGYLKSREAAILFMAVTGQFPPHTLLVGTGISNISAEALVALESGHRHDIDDHQLTFGESWEQTLRLGGKALGDADGMAAWDDRSAQTVWKDTTPRSLAQVADALGKLSTLLGVPEEALWERIPGTTQQDIERWKEMRANGTALDALAGMFDQAADGTSSDPAADTKSKADALGSLIRSGVDPESAARQVGLDVDFTGAVPVSLRLPEADAAALEVA